MFRMERAVFPLKNEYSLDLLLLLHQGKRRDKNKVKGEGKKANEILWDSGTKRLRDGGMKRLRDLETK